MIDRMAATHSTTAMIPNPIAVGSDPLIATSHRNPGDDLGMIASELQGPGSKTMISMNVARAALPAASLARKATVGWDHFQATHC